VAGVSSLATPIRKIHVSDQGHFGFARIDAAELGLAQWATCAQSRWGRIVVAPSGECRRSGLLSGKGIAHHGGRARGHAGDRRNGATASLDTRLVVAADGVQSAVRSAFGVDAESRDYQQTAVITTVLPQRFHDHVAYERFTQRTAGAAALEAADAPWS